MIDRIHRFVAITGRATDEATGNSVAAARVDLQRQQPPSERSELAVTGPDGYFYFMDLPNGEYQIRATTQGAPPASVNVRLTRTAGKVTKPVVADVTMRLTEPTTQASEAQSGKSKTDKRQKKQGGG